MALSTASSSTYPVLSTPPHPQSDSLPTDSSQFAEADKEISELIQVMEQQTNALETSGSVASRPNPIPKLIFRGKPLAMDLYKPKRKRIARSPKPNVPSSRKSRNVELKRDAKGHFAVHHTTPRAQATESSTTDTTRTPAPSKPTYKVLTEPVSPDPPSNTIITANQVAEEVNRVAVADGQPTTQAVVLDVNSPMIHSITFPMPTAEELASFLYSTYIVPKLTENSSFFLCREQLYHKYYHTHLISFFQSNLGTTCMSYSQVDTMIFAALHLLGFN
jgi:hypothetical protein